MDMMFPLANTLLERLAWTSAQAAVLVGVLWLLGRLLPHLSAAMRCALWWLLGAQLILGLAWQAPLQLPILSPHSPTTPVATIPAFGTHHGQDAAVHATDQAAASTTTRPTTSPSFPWRQVVAALWLAGLLVQLAAAMSQWRHTRRVLRDSHPLVDAHMQNLCARQAQQLGLRRCPRLRVSAAIDSPQVTGLWRPTVLLPARQTLAPAERVMALTHELVHLRRGDLSLGWVPAVAQWLFFFHPLVRLATREYALYREAACDAQVLRLHHAAPQDYGRLLLHLGVAHPLHAGLAGASPTFHNLRRRLVMLQQTSSATPRARSWLLVALVALAGVLPYRVVATNHSTQDADKASVGNANRAALPLPPVPPAPPPLLPPPPPAPPPPPTDYGFNASHVHIDIHSDARQGFALFDGDSAMVNGTDADAAAVKRLHKSGEPMLWFRHGDRSYLIRDKATIERARNIYAPMIELARQEGRLAGEQGKIAGQQAGLAARDTGLAQAQASLARQQARLAMETATRQVDAGKQVSDTQRRELDAQRRGLDAAQARLEQKHAALRTELDAKRHALETQQAKLEKQQKALEQRQQRVTHKTEQAMGRLIDEAATKGLTESISQD